jgi:hypothetical protein
MGYHEAQNQYAVESAGEIECVDSGGLFQIGSNGERVFVEGVDQSILGFSVFFQDRSRR